MLTPEQLKVIPDELVKYIQDVEDFLIYDMARRISKEAMLTATAEQQLNIARELGFGKDIEKQLQEALGITENQMETILRDAAETSVSAENALYKAAGKGTADILSPTMQGFINEAIRQTTADILNLSGSMGFAIKEGGKTVFKGVGEAYVDELNKSVSRLRTGATDPRTAIRDAVNSLADSGIQYVDYASGYRNRLDVAVRRAVMTGTQQMTHRMTDRLMDELGAEYVEVTAHPGARPSHSVWQGRVFHRGGREDKYPDFVSSTGYGTGEGLGGWRC
jgi:hypothetical protein